LDPQEKIGAVVLNTGVRFFRQQHFFREKRRVSSGFENRDGPTEIVLVKAIGLIFSD
jgi:hypothetical protein